MGNNLVIGVKLAPKLTYGVDDPRYHPRQYISEGYKLGEPTLLKHYLNGDIGICLKLRCRRGQADAEEFYALFSDLDAVWGAEADNGWQAPVDVESLPVGGPDPDFLAHGDGLGDDDKEPVLIYVVEVCESSENRVVRRRSVARLYAADDFLGGDANVLYCSALTGVFEFFRLGVNGERVMFLNRVPGPQDKSGKEMVEARPQVMDHLTSQNGEAIKAIGYRDKQARLEDIIPRIILKLSGDRIRFRVRSDERGDLSVEILDAFIGPLNFRSTPAQTPNH